MGRLPSGAVSFNQRNFSRAMGLAYQPGKLYVGTLYQVWRLEQVLRAGEIANNAFDAVFVPRNAQVTGDLDVHEVAVDRAGRVIFVNTKYSCLATLDLKNSYRPIWKPPFISKLAAEDRCHLNGLAMENGRPRYVTAVSRSDVLGGWRERRHEGGVLIDVLADSIVTDQLSMPHSPRISEGTVYVLDSGRGMIVRVDPASGSKEDVAFCPGFLRGMSIHNGHAVVTVSKPRDGSFKELHLQEAIASRDGEPWCGILVVNLSTGDIVEWVRLEGHISELFDVTVLGGMVCPMALGTDGDEIRTMITHDHDVKPIVYDDSMWGLGSL